MPFRSASADRPSGFLPGLGGGRVPWTAVTAMVCAAVAVIPLLLMAVLLFAVGGLSPDAAREAWVWVVFLAPVVQFVAAMLLVTRRGWLPLVLAVLPSALLTWAVYAAARDEGDAVGVGPLLIVFFPLLAAGFAAAPPTRRWLAARPGRARATA
ncbi:hypothetical protein [Blastococcus sp. URHD0036]|uniref:hypothetical protein n=1 Tax=Blastococcus sp. URHD0036 TaxID=1380356 RepID=UPI0004961095|nr:hypothetical protein [Blastococcus sp. URHD0036]